MSLARGCIRLIVSQLMSKIAKAMTSIQYGLLSEPILAVEGF